MSNQFLLLTILLEILFFNFGDWLFWFLLIFYVAQQFFPTAVLRSNHNLCTYPSKLMLSSILKHCKKIILSIINMRNFCSNEFFFSKRIEGRLIFFTGISIIFKNDFYQIWNNSVGCTYYQKITQVHPNNQSHMEI